MSSPGDVLRCLAPIAPFVLAAGLFLGCAPVPSARPLGVGPLPPGAKLSSDLRREAHLRSLKKPPHRRPDGLASDAPEPKGAEAPPPVSTAASPPAVAKT